MNRRSCSKLRVLIAGQHTSFVHVLATNIERWGHEVTVLPAMEAQCGDSAWTPLSGSYPGNQEKRAVDKAGKFEGDVLLYDLDASFHLPTSLECRDAPISHTAFGFASVPVTIALSSDSVSSKTLDQIGAVAVLQKPFEMGRLQHYLRVLRRLLLEVEETPLSAHQLRVLVVDDDVSIANLIRNSLIFESKYEVAVAYDGLEALEQCLDWRPHCIVTDLIMPHLNGYQVMRCLSASSLQILPAFVIMSALAHPEVPEDHAYLRGTVVAYVNKPFAIDHLLNAIEQVCIEGV